MEYQTADAAYDVPRIPLPPIKEDLELPGLPEGLQTVVPYPCTIPVTQHTAEANARCQK